MVQGTPTLPTLGSMVLGLVCTLLLVPPISLVRQHGAALDVENATGSHLRARHRQEKGPANLKGNQSWLCSPTFVQVGQVNNGALQLAKRIISASNTISIS